MILQFGMKDKIKANDTKMAVLFENYIQNRFTAGLSYLILKLSFGVSVFASNLVSLATLKARLNPYWEYLRDLLCLRLIVDMSAARQVVVTLYEGVENKYLWARDKITPTR